MKIFSALYERVMRWSRHPHAPWYLGVLSFAESSFFPIPPDTMLAPMSLARPERAWRYALLTTITSVLGGVFGYLLGMYFYGLIEPALHQFNLWEKFVLVKEKFNEYGVWFIFVAGFSPIPYKVFTIGAGVLNMAFLPFVAASFIGRGARFFLVAGLMRWGGPRMEQHLRRYVDILGWVTLVAIVVVYLILRE
ncbi:MAG: DedA family protein [Gammaproteobacteria bacterium]|nr:DedA family protein [Gammaproteobacteria bacterium]